MTKRIFAISLVLCGIFMFSGCGDKTTTKISKYEETMKEYATNYYNSFQKGTEGLIDVKVTVEQLKNSVELGIANYDMSKLSVCTSDSYVVLKINQTNNDVDSVEYHLQCNE